MGLLTNFVWHVPTKTKLEYPHPRAMHLTMTWRNDRYGTSTFYISW